MLIVFFKKKVLFNSYLIPFKGKEGAEEIFFFTRIWSFFFSL